MIGLIMAQLAAVAAAPAGPILMDGACSDAAWQAAPAHDLSRGATLRIAADAHFLYFCVDPPKGSFASTDLYFREQSGRVTNLHASAKLGERVLVAGGWPDYDWWNNAGWTANVVEFNGVTQGDAGPRGDFRPSRGREIQIARGKFAEAGLRLMISVSALAGPDGSMIDVSWPEGSSPDKPEGWPLLSLPPLQLNKGLVER